MASFIRNFFILVFSTALLALPARAEFSPEITEFEKAVFAFFKIANGTPYFDEWIKNSPKYLHTDQNHREEIYEQEALRLKWGFGVYDEKEDFLKISTGVYLELEQSADGPFLKFTFLDSAQQEIPYFPYPYGKEWVALIVSDLEAFTAVPLGPKQLAAVSAHLTPGKRYPAEMRMRVRPTSSDVETPMVQENSNFWLMMGDTAYIEFAYAAEEKAEKTVLWSYTAPWYLSEEEEDLIDILNKRQ